MKRRRALRAIAFGIACHACKLAERDVPRERLSVAAEASAPAVPDSSDGAARVEAAGESFELHRWSFDVVTSTLAIVDLGMHGSLTEALGPDGRVAVNGGFFDPDGRPVGLAYAGGTTLSRYSATMSGGVFFTVDGVARVVATEDFDPRTHVDFAVQCRPRLVVDRRPNVKRDDGQRAPRTALCVRDAGRTVDVVVAEPSLGTRGPSLFALGQFLAEQQHCDDALNLDGGPSTGAAYRAGPGGVTSAFPPRGPLRHAVVVR